MFGFSILKFDTSLQKASVLNYKLLQKKISKSCYFFSADEQKSTRGSIHSKGMKYSSEFHFILELAPKENPNFLWYGDSPCWSYFPSLFSFISSYFHSRKKLQKKKNENGKEPEVLEVKIRFLLLFPSHSLFFPCEKCCGERGGKRKQHQRVHLKASEHGSWIFSKKSQPRFPVKWFPHFHVNVFT